MYVFEAVYENAITDSMVTRTIEFDGDNLLDSKKECYLYAMERAYDLAELDEDLTEVRLVAC